MERERESGGARFVGFACVSPFTSLLDGRLLRAVCWWKTKEVDRKPGMMDGYTRPCAAPLSDSLLFTNARVSPPSLHPWLPHPATASHQMRAA